MNRQTPKDPTVSVRRRLLNKGRESGRPFNEILQYFAMERFLYRLSRSQYANGFVLKGALMFNVWRGSFSLPTMDIDLLGRLSNDVENVITALRSVCTQEVEPDGVTRHADEKCLALWDSQPRPPTLLHQATCCASV